MFCYLDAVFKYTEKEKYVTLLVSTSKIIYFIE